MNRGYVPSCRRHSTPHGGGGGGNLTSPWFGVMPFLGYLFMKESGLGPDLWVWFSTNFSIFQIYGNSF